jgi:nicotinate-nucleotide adenylyltransferase
MKQNQEQIETIIYGGAFNPPTRAHQAILQACVNRAEQTGADVWLLPSGNRTDKTIEVSRDDRLRMLDALISDVLMRTVAVHVETSELDRIVPTETFDTVIEMNDKYPDRRFTWVFGSDSVETMPQWYMGEWMMNNLSMLVIERPGTPIQTLGRYTSRLPVATIDISSTQVRERLKSRKAIDDLVTPSVLAQLRAGQ